MLIELSNTNVFIFPRAGEPGDVSADDSHVSAGLGGMIHQPFPACWVPGRRQEGAFPVESAEGIGGFYPAPAAWHFSVQVIFISDFYLCLLSH